MAALPKRISMTFLYMQSVSRFRLSIILLFCTLIIAISLKPATAQTTSSKRSLRDFAQ